MHKPCLPAIPDLGHAEQVGAAADFVALAKVEVETYRPQL
jgi:hypothetical protein